MKDLTFVQIDFLLTFFRSDSYPGAENVGRSLITTGKCIVAGTEGIWKGGVGNFIRVKAAEGAVGCSEYTMDVENFMSSRFFADVYAERMKNLAIKKIKAVDEFDEMEAMFD